MSFRATTQGILQQNLSVAISASIAKHLKNHYLCKYRLTGRTSPVGAFMAFNFDMYDMEKQRTAARRHIWFVSFLGSKDGTAWQYESSRQATLGCYPVSGILFGLSGGDEHPPGDVQQQFWEFQKLLHYLAGHIVPPGDRRRTVRVNLSLAVRLKFRIGLVLKPPGRQRTAARRHIWFVSFLGSKDGTAWQYESSRQATLGCYPVSGILFGLSGGDEHPPGDVQQQFWEFQKLLHYLAGHIVPPGDRRRTVRVNLSLAVRLKFRIGLVLVRKSKAEKCWI
ncbi:hypothetical protein DEO72_LG10g2315 [Vigna unguiculata]|uniref:Uncharacterized protein n=1 Tax=Vigna unguiculata TaxID=3917 RepID=A0A4D6NDW3_VIGUN|nr:hypothetical protein DEO72_LG10g2315 [Vigna unguiculata]